MKNIIIITIAIIATIIIISTIVIISNTKIHKTQTYINKEKNNLKQGQLKMTNMLREFDKICREHHLKYWCVCGTLIGTVRHMGWIPHDADIDVAMLEKDFYKLKLIIQKKLSKRFWFQDKSTDKYYKSTIAKIRYLDAYYCDDKNRDWHNGIQLDIFIFKENSDLLIPYNRISDIKPIHSSMIFPLKELKFEDITVYVPNEYKKYCINAWGGYPPPMLPKNKQIPHEGRISFTIPKWMKNKYLNLYL